MSEPSEPNLATNIGFNYGVHDDNSLIYTGTSKYLIIVDRMVTDGEADSFNSSPTTWSADNNLQNICWCV